MKFLNFGSLNIDKVYNVEHFPLPGETLASDKYAVHVGGKGLNQSVSLAKAGAKVYHAGAIGEDGEFLKEYLSSVGVDVSLINTVDTATGHAIIEVDKNGQNSILLFGGANKEISPDYCDKVLSSFTAGDVILMQNEISSVGYIMEAAHKKGLRIAFNPSPIDQNIEKLPLRYVEWMLLNETEGNCLSGETEPKKIISALLKKYPDTKIILTLGGDGSIYADKNITVAQDVFKTDIVDTTAAGDTFTGYFLNAVSLGESPADALKIASKASSITVSRAGAAETIPFNNEVII